MRDKHADKSPTHELARLRASAHVNWRLLNAPVPQLARALPRCLMPESGKPTKVLLLGFLAALSTPFDAMSICLVFRELGHRLLG